MRCGHRGIYIGGGTDRYRANQILIGGINHFNRAFAERFDPLAADVQLPARVHTYSTARRLMRFMQFNNWHVFWDMWLNVSSLCVTPRVVATTEA